MREMLQHIRAAHTQPPPSRLPLVSWFAGVAAILVGGFIFVGWMLNVAALRDLGSIRMKTNASLAMTLSGIAMLLLVRPDPAGPRRWLARLCAAVVLLLGALTLSENLVGWNLGIDTLLATEPPGARGTTSPNRMGVPGSTSFTLLGMAFLLLSRRRSAAGLVQSLALAGVTIAMLSLAGYVYQANELYGIAQWTAIAIETAATLLLLALGVLCARPREGIASAITAPDAGGVMLRRLLPPVIILPILLGWLRLRGEAWGHYDTAMGTAMLVLVLVAAFTVLVYLGSLRISRAVAALKRQREYFAVTLGSIGDAVIVTDTAGRVTFMNPEAERLTGWKILDAAERPLPEVFVIVNERTRQPVENPVAKVLSAGSVVGLANHTILIAKDGRQTPIDDSGAPVRLGNGPVQGVVLVFRDITNRQQAEQALRRSEARWNAAIESFAEGAIIATEDEQVIYWNPAARAMHGFTRPDEGIEPLEKTPITFELWTPDGAHKLELDEWPMRRIKRGEVVRNLELRVRRPDQGWEKIFSYSGTMVDTAGGERLIFLTCHDLTELRRAEAELHQAKADAEQANHAKDQFLAVLSHELRTPLAPVLAAVSLIEREPSLSSQTREDLEIIRRNVEMEARLIDDLLDVTRIARGKVQLHRSVIDLRTVIRHAADVVRPDINERHIRFAVNFSDDHPMMVDGDAARLQQVFWNLIKNAAKFTLLGGSIDVAAARNGRSVTVRVTDTGIGIDPEVLPRLFRPFEQGSTGVARQFGGLGLGLAISKAMVELHGGSIKAHSDGKGQGAVFTVTLPLTTAPPPDPSPASGRGSG